MKIGEVIPIIKAQILLKRTIQGRHIVDNAISVLEASLSDNKNWHNEALKCLNCGIIISSLLVPEGCVNCGSKDLKSIDYKINKGE
jgi:hypothetical protein